MYTCTSIVHVRHTNVAVKLCVSIEAEACQVTQGLAQAKIKEIGTLHERNTFSNYNYTCYESSGGSAFTTINPKPRGNHPSVPAKVHLHIHVCNSYI